MLPHLEPHHVVMLRERLRLLRRERGMTLKQLQDLSGIPLQTISHIERGFTDNPGVHTVIALAKALEVTVDYLAGQTQDRYGSR